MKNTRRHTNGTFRYNSSNFAGFRLMIATVAIGAFINWLYAPVELHNPLVGQVEAKQPVELIGEPPTVEQKVLTAWGKVEGPRALKLLKECENKSLNPKAINYNRNGSTDHGLFQINSIHGYSQFYLEDIDNNIKVAYKIYQDRGWEAWSCAWVLNETPFYMKGVK